MLQNPLAEGLLGTDSRQRLAHMVLLLVSSIAHLDRPEGHQLLFARSCQDPSGDWRKDGIWPHIALCGGPCGFATAIGPRMKSEGPTFVVVASESITHDSFSIL